MNSANNISHPKAIQQIMDKLLESLNRLTKIKKQVDKEEINKTILQTSHSFEIELAALKKYLADNPEFETTYEFHDSVSDILEEIIQLRTHDKIRQLMPHTPLPGQLQDFINTLKQILARSPDVAELVAEPVLDDELTRKIHKAIITWDPQHLPHDAMTFAAAQRYYEQLEQKAELARVAAESMIAESETKLEAMQKKQQKKPGSIDLALSEQFFQTSLRMYAKNTAALLAEEAAIAARAMVDELRARH